MSRPVTQAAVSEQRHLTEAALRALPQSGILVLVGLMGAGKTTIGRRVAARLGLPFIDADSEIEHAAGCSIPEIFARLGEPAFRDGERRVILRLLNGPPCVLATGGGAYMDARTREAIRSRSRSLWLRATLHVLTRRLSGRVGRPLLAQGDPATILADLQAKRHPFYAEADIIVNCGDDSVDLSAQRVLEALARYDHPVRVPVELDAHRYDVIIGPDVIARAGALLAPVLPQKRAVVITDEHVAALHLPRLAASLDATGVAVTTHVVPPGEDSKSLARYGALVDAIVSEGIERRTTVIGFGGGVVGDLAGFVAATALRGVPFVQIPTTLLSQVDSSVGGKTGVNASGGKNLIGAFYQPQMVLADTSALATLPPRERLAGYAEIVKAGLIDGQAFFSWCEANGAAVLSGDPEAQIEAVRRACAFKAAVVQADEREQAAEGGRALLNLGHSFGHALEAWFGYDGRLLHGEAVSIGLHLATAFSVSLGICPPHVLARLDSHLRANGMPAGLDWLPLRLSADWLVAAMGRDKKMRDGRLALVLIQDIGDCFTTRDISMDQVRAFLRTEGCGV
ncbi:3-dehydroquinate synthase [Acidomonas methanolica]|uniref:3-dehydroquinate synthase n=1 Tax=Acidomonas methanolica TaxID=437 RepID=UPI002119DB06|nr:3-dehydroquinate synthase [Acidomonas methanolica]MCQ9155386.1 3-dehydroquinate synthase [Acidomonas methanolica]